MLWNVPETTKDEDAAQFFNICGGMTVDSSRAETLGGEKSISLINQNSKISWWIGSERKTHFAIVVNFFLILPFTIYSSTISRKPGTVQCFIITTMKSSAEYRLCYTWESLKTCSQWKNSRRNQGYRYLPACEKLNSKMLYRSNN